MSELVSKSQLIILKTISIKRESDQSNHLDTIYQKVENVNKKRSNASKLLFPVSGSKEEAEKKPLEVKSTKKIFMECFNLDLEIKNEFKKYLIKEKKLKLKNIETRVDGIEKVNQLFAQIQGKIKAFEVKRREGPREAGGGRTGESGNGELETSRIRIEKDESETLRTQLHKLERKNMEMEILINHKENLIRKLKMEQRKKKINLEIFYNRMLEKLLRILEPSSLALSKGLDSEIKQMENEYGYFSKQLISFKHSLVNPKDSDKTVDLSLLKKLRLFNAKALQGNVFRFSKLVKTYKNVVKTKIQGYKNDIRQNSHLSSKWKRDSEMSQNLKSMVSEININYNKNKLHEVLYGQVTKKNDGWTHQTGSREGPLRIKSIRRPQRACEPFVPQIWACPRFEWVRERGPSTPTSTKRILEDLESMTRSLARSEERLEVPPSDPESRQQLEKKAERLQKEQSKFVRQEAKLDKLLSEADTNRKDQIEQLKKQLRELREKRRSDLDEKAAFLREIKSMDGRLRGMWEVRLQSKSRFSSVQEVVLKVRSELRELGRAKAQKEKKIKKMSERIETMVSKEQTSTKMMKNYQDELGEKKRLILMLKKKISDGKLKGEKKEKHKKKPTRAESIQEINNSLFRAEFQAKLDKLKRLRNDLSQRLEGQVQAAVARVDRVEKRVKKKLKRAKVRSRTGAQKDPESAQRGEEASRLETACRGFLAQALDKREIETIKRESFMLDLGRYFGEIREKMANLCEERERLESMRRKSDAQELKTMRLELEHKQKTERVAFLEEKVEFLKEKVQMLESQAKEQVSGSQVETIRELLSHQKKFNEEIKAKLTRLSAEEPAYLTVPKKQKKKRSTPSFVLQPNPKADEYGLKLNSQPMALDKEPCSGPVAHGERNEDDPSRAHWTLDSQTISTVPSDMNQSQDKRFALTDSCGGLITNLRMIKLMMSPDAKNAKRIELTDSGLGPKAVMQSKEELLANPLSKSTEVNYQRVLSNQSEKTSQDSGEFDVLRFRKNLNEHSRLDLRDQSDSFHLGIEKKKLEGSEMDSGVLSFDESVNIGQRDASQLKMFSFRTPLQSETVEPEGEAPPRPKETPRPGRAAELKIKRRFESVEEVPEEQLITESEKKAKSPKQFLFVQSGSEKEKNAEGAIEKWNFKKRGQARGEVVPGRDELRTLENNFLGTNSTKTPEARSEAAKGNEMRNRNGKSCDDSFDIEFNFAPKKIGEMDVIGSIHQINTQKFNVFYDQSADNSSLMDPPDFSEERRKNKKTGF